MKLCLYGKLPHKRGWVLCYLRRTDGMCSLTPRLADSKLFKIRVFPWFAKPAEEHWQTTFMVTTRGQSNGFG